MPCQCITYPCRACIGQGGPVPLPAPNGSGTTLPVPSVGPSVGLPAVVSGATPGGIRWPLLVFVGVLGLVVFLTWRKL